MVSEIANDASRGQSALAGALTARRAHERRVWRGIASGSAQALGSRPFARRRL